MLKWIVAITCLFIIATTLLMYGLRFIGIAEAYLLVPATVGSLFVLLLLRFPLTEKRLFWRKLSVQSDFAKSMLMLFGAIIVTTGLSLFAGALGGDLTRVTIDSGIGTAVVICGFYIVWRFRW